MGRKPKFIDTRLEIIRLGTRLFLEEGFGSTSATRISTELSISPGNLTFHFPSKEDLLSEVVKLLCSFQKMVCEEEKEEDLIRTICNEQLIMAAVCELFPTAKEFYLTAYSHPGTLDIIRKSDNGRAKLAFRSYCSHWSETDFTEAENLVSGIEYGSLATTEESAPLESRIRGALDTILYIYNVPRQARQRYIEDALSKDYYALGERFFLRFKQYAYSCNEQAIAEAKAIRDEKERQARELKERRELKRRLKEEKNSKAQNK